MESYGRDRHSPERKRQRVEASRHDSYSGGGGGSYNSGGRYEGGGGYAPERRGYSGERERHITTSTPFHASRRLESEFRKPSRPSPRGGYRGSRGRRGAVGRRERGGGFPPRRRLGESSYGIRKRGIMIRAAAERRAKIIRMRSRRKPALDMEKSDSEEEKKETKESSEVKAKKDKPETAATEEEEATEAKDTETTEAEETKEEGVEKADESKPKEKKEKVEEAKTSSKRSSSNPFIKLVCPQCNVNVSTFRRYEAHLHGRTHKISMSKVATKQRSILIQMRQAQRKAQNELEKNSSTDELASRSMFCNLCKLNFKQLKADHQASQAHRNMKKYLLPFCKVCKITCKSPMNYESHLCSIDHLKRKQRNVGSSEGSAEEDNLEDFTTIDSVGEVEETPASADDEKEEVSVGIEQIRKVEVHYCDLCRTYLPRDYPRDKSPSEVQKMLASHCRIRPHMQRYIRYQENQELKKRAEKLQRKETAEREKKKEEKSHKEGDESITDASESKDKSKSGTDKDSKLTDEDKLWESVDKDIGELLEEGDTVKSDDDDDDSRINNERFDRFKSDDKDKSGEDAKPGEEQDGAEAKSDDQPDKKAENA